MAYEDRTYHGVHEEGSGGGTWSDEDEWQPGFRIFVEKPEPGPTERLNVRVLYELEPPDPDMGGFGWGWNGTSTSFAAAAILADALDLPDTAGIFVDRGSQDPALTDLREGFCEEVLREFCDDWRLSRRAVVRWARGWYLQRGDDDLPLALRWLPPLRHR